MSMAIPEQKVKKERKTIKKEGDKRQYKQINKQTNKQINKQEEGDSILVDVREQKERKTKRKKRRGNKMTASDFRN